MSEKEESGQAGDPPLRKVDPAPSGSGLLGRITIANRQIQIQIEYSPGPPPRITGVAALAGKILSRHVFNLENILDPHTKQEIMTNCAHVFSNLFRERLISKARERIAANQRAISAQTSDSESAAAENKILEWPVNAASTPFLQTDSQPVLDDTPALNQEETTLFQEGPDLPGAMLTPGVEEPEVLSESSCHVELPAGQCGQEAPGAPADSLIGMESTTQERTAQIIVSIKGVRLSALIAPDRVDMHAGIGIQASYDSEAIRRFWVEASTRLQTLSQKHGMGGVKVLLMEADSGALFIIPVQPHSGFLVLMDPGANMVIMKKTMERIIGGA